MLTWEGFHKYFGVQGLLSLALVGGYIAAVFVQVELPTGYTELMSLTFGFYFAKNGGSIVSAFRK